MANRRPSPEEMLARAAREEEKRQAGRVRLLLVLSEVV
jgi:hypothetical protein